MKKSIALLIAGVLVIGTAGSIIAGSGSKCAQKANAAQTIESTQGTATVVSNSPEAMKAAGECGGCPVMSEVSAEKSGCCPGKVEGASATSTSESSKMSAEKVSQNSACEGKAAAGCAPKVEGASTQPVIETTKKAS